ncbi:hypothetical protein [Streptomyces wuyuanensis]|uniref:hypothetical protein n=1 Tax=Streptomyces wuyuanensis TaxID=1196353 RepID=UPI0034442B1A
MDDSLSFESFLVGARKSAHRAMDDHGRGEFDEFALHAGVAVEKLSKAVLAKKNPIYLVEMRGNAEMLFHLGGHRKAGKVRTVGASESIARLRMLDLLPANRQLDLLIDLRNGVAHASSGDQAKPLLTVFVQTVVTLTHEVREPSAHFWGRWTSAVGAVLDKRRTEVERDVALRIRQARHRFDDRFKGLPEGAKEQILQAPQPGEGSLLGPVTLANGEDIWFTVASLLCPACGGRASATLTPASTSPTGTTVSPDAFQCRLCGLELNDLEEMKASRIDVTTIDLPSPLTISFGPSLPVGLEFGETHAG